MAGEKEAPWWGRLMHERGPAREALLWRLARMAQAAGISFNLGIVSGLIGLVMVKHVGFFWETTTEFAMGAGRYEGMPELETYLRPEDIAFAIRTVLEQPRRLRTQYWTLWSMAQEA